MDGAKLSWTFIQILDGIFHLNSRLTHVSTYSQNRKKNFIVTSHNSEKSILTTIIGFSEVMQPTAYSKRFQVYLLQKGRTIYVIHNNIYKQLGASCAVAHIKKSPHITPT